jgi:hypothetical protein
MADFYPQTLVDYAQILGALATSAAVMVSLYLANNKPKLRVTCDVRDLVLKGQTAIHRPKYLVISAVNIGEFQATITGIGWTTGRFTRKQLWAHQDTSVGDYLVQNPKLPNQIGHGETAQFYLPLQGEYSWLGYLDESGMFIERLRTRKLFNSLRAVVFTSVGKNFYCKPNAAALNLMWKHQQVCMKAETDND